MLRACSPLHHASGMHLARFRSPLVSVAWGDCSAVLSSSFVWDGLVKAHGHLFV